MGLDLSQHGETALGADLLGGASGNGRSHAERAGRQRRVIRLFRPPMTTTAGRAEAAPGPVVVIRSLGDGARPYRTRSLTLTSPFGLTLIFSLTTAGPPARGRPRPGRPRGRPPGSPPRPAA